MAIQKNYLDGYFKKEMEGVFMTTLFEVDKEVYENDLREEGREEGRQEKNIETLCIMMEKQGMDYEEACDFLEIPKEEWELYREPVEKKIPPQNIFTGRGR